MSPTLVYFIQAGPFIKIGLSTSRGLANRLSNIQVGCPYPASIILTKPTDTPYDSEKLYHKTFEAFHYRGEWFRISPRMLLKVLNCPPVM